MKFKLFFGYVSDIEQEICEWLNGLDIIILSINQSAATDNNHNLIAMFSILYKDREGGF